MRHLCYLLLIIVAIALTACALITAAPSATLARVTPKDAFTPQVMVTLETTVAVSTAVPITVLPSGQVTPMTSVPTSPTPIPPLPDGMGPTELKYRVLAEFPDFFFCDPDYYPVARQEESEAARQHFREMQANTEEFNTILVHNNLSELQDFTDEQILLIYRDYKKLNAIQFETSGGGYQFRIQVAKSEGNGEQITGLIDGQGTILVQQRQPTIATCPICLAVGTLIDTPGGPVPVEDLNVGMLAWTVDKTGERVAMPLSRVSRTVVPATHQVVGLVLSDGRELHVSPGHPTIDGRTVGQLQIADTLDGAVVVAVERIPYSGHATYDLLPAGDTGFYWANGILIASTLAEQSRAALSSGVLTR